MPYFLSPTFPDDEALDTAAVRTMQQWDDAARRAVAAAQKRKPLEDIGTIFTLCHNPVSRTKGDDAACGAEGFSPRMGDLRYSVLHWVDTETMEGLLGYGPSATDPLTGEIVSGKAHVYGAAVNTYATYALDTIRFFNEDIDTQTLIYGEHFADDLRKSAAATGVQKPRSASLDRRAGEDPAGRQAASRAAGARPASPLRRPPRGAPARGRPGEGRRLDAHERRGATRSGDHRRPGLGGRRSRGQGAARSHRRALHRGHETPAEAERAPAKSSRRTDRSHRAQHRGPGEEVRRPHGLRRHLARAARGHLRQHRRARGRPHAGAAPQLPGQLRQPELPTCIGTCARRT
jgi:hypothetical protein